MTIPAEQWASAWSDFPSTTVQQSRLAEADLDRWLAGHPHASFDPFRNLLTPILPQFENFLEIGSGWGGYSQVLHHLDDTKRYFGVDVSEHMVKYALKRWQANFRVMNSEHLEYGDGQFDVTCLSGLIQHLADYAPSIKEAVRVAKRWVFLHRVEATTGESHEFIRKAYDSQVPTRRVNEVELILFCEGCGLTLRDNEKWSDGGMMFNCSYLFQKV